VLDDAAALDRDALRDRVLALEAALAAAERRADEAASERDRLREAYRHLQLELELQRRRLFIAKAERVDTRQLDLEFAATLAKLDELAGLLTPDDDATAAGAGADPEPEPKPKRRPTGRRTLREVDLPEERIVVVNPALDGRVERIGAEETCQLGWRPGGSIRIVTVRIKYRSDEEPKHEPTAASNEDVVTEGAPVPPPSPPPPSAGVAESAVSAPGSTPAPPSPPARPDAATRGTIVIAPVPPQILPRSIATCSLLAHIASDKFCDGLPLYRQEDRFARQGVRIDRGSMSRWLEELGGIMGSSLVHAMRVDALAHAFCLATDATGVLVQPLRDGNTARRACRRAHFFVQLADADHVFFEYTPKETSAVVGELFRGFTGYVQADAKSVYDILFRPPEQRGPPDDADVDRAVRHEVGCWSHLRTKFWEAAITKDVVAREGLARIRRIFEHDRSWRDRPPVEIKALRDLHLRPHVDAFFAWVAVEYEKVKARRGFLRTALGYAQRQQGPLTRFFDDGRLRLTNNHSERELRRVAVGRKAWLFVGSDDHGQAAGNLLTLIASARLHGLNPEAYLRDVFRVFPHWPRDRYLELCPRDWRATRARLDAAQLEAELGPLDVPPPPSSEQSAAR
jgi:transposase